MNHVKKFFGQFSDISVRIAWQFRRKVVILPPNRLFRQRVQNAFCLHILKVMKRISFYICGACVALMLTACQGGKTAAGDADGGDTVQMKYAQLLTIVRHGGEQGAENQGVGDAYDYAEAIIRNPWKEGSVLHRYILIPKGKEGDKTKALLAKRRGAAGGGARCATDTVRTPVESSVVFTSPHCQLMYELGCQQAITGVCDLGYINIPDIKKRASAKNECAGEAKPIVDCGSSMAPDIERIIALHPEALLISPFENSGGFGKLDKLRLPIIETADYMETSPLGRAEWMKFYGMLFGSARADSLFTAIEKEYLWLKEQAKTLPKGLSILTERKTGGVWYVPGGQSTIGVLLKDANARYIFSEDTHSGSLAMSTEQILAKGKDIDIWAFKYFEPQPLTRPQLLQEYDGYKALFAFNSKNIYECSTSSQPYFELTSFHPEILLREFILLTHPAKSARFAKFAPAIQRLGHLRFYKEMTQADDLPVMDRTAECGK